MTRLGQPGHSVLEHEEPGVGTPAGWIDGVPEALTLALELMPDSALAVDRDGRIVGANGAALDLFGHPLEVLLGQRVELLVPARFRHAHRYHRATFERSPHRRSLGQALQVFGQRRDGTEFPADISLAPVEIAGEPLVVAAVRDVTERAIAAAAISQLAGIVSSSRDGILTVTTSGVVTTWNPGAEQLLGTSTEEAIGTHIGRWIPEGEAPVLEELMSFIASGRSPSARDTVWCRSDGRCADVAISLSPMNDEHGELQGFSILVRDASERKAVEAAHLREERRRAATTEIRIASLSGGPLDDTLELICRRAVELVGGEGAAMALEGDGELGTLASWGTSRGRLARRLAAVSLSHGDAPSSMLGLPSSNAGAPVQAIAAVVPETSGGRGALVVTLPPGREEDGDARQVVEGLAGQAALAIELSHARATRDRLLVAEDRGRIARDLHDLVIQRLFAIGMSLQALRQLVEDPGVSQRISGATEELDATIRKIRTTIFALESPAEGTFVSGHPTGAPPGSPDDPRER